MSQLTYKMQMDNLLKRYSVSQSVRLAGILNASGLHDIHTQVSGPYSLLFLKLSELVVVSCSMGSLGFMCLPLWKQGIKASVYPSLRQSLAASFGILK